MQLSEPYGRAFVVVRLFLIRFSNAYRLFSYFILDFTISIAFTTVYLQTLKVYRFKGQSHQFNHFDSLPVSKSNNFNHDTRKQDDYFSSNKNRKQNDYSHDSHEDKEEKDLESLRKTTHENRWNTNNDDQSANKELNFGKNKHDNSFNSDYDSGFDYDEDEWINWDRKRSLPEKQNGNIRPLKALEFQMTKALQKQAEQPSKVHYTTVPPTTISESTKKVYEHKGQKEVVLSRPATPLRRHFSDSVLEALTETTKEMHESNADDVTKQNKKDAEKSHQSSSLGTKKQKRFVFNESSLVQQLNDLKGKIKA